MRWSRGWRPSVLELRTPSATQSGASGASSGQCCDFMAKELLAEYKKKKKVVLCKDETRLKTAAYSFIFSQRSILFRCSVFLSLQFEERKIQKTNNESRNQTNPTVRLFYLKAFFFTFPFLSHLWCKHVTLDGLLFHIQQQPCPSPS